MQHSGPPGSHTPVCGASPRAEPRHAQNPNRRAKFMPSLLCLRGYASKPPATINQVMSRACGYTPEHTPLRVQSTACHCKQRMAYKARTPPCAARPHAQSQEGQRNHHDAHEPSYSLKQRVPAPQAANNHQANQGGSPSDCLPLWVAIPPDNS